MYYFKKPLVYPGVYILREDKQIRNYFTYHFYPKCLKSNELTC